MTYLPYPLIEKVALEDLHVGDFLTYHGSRKATSRLISWGEESSGQWNVNEKIKKLFPAPSHILMKIGTDIFVEADWGDPLFFLPFIRVNTGVRVVFSKSIRARKGKHIAWRMSKHFSQTEKKRMQTFAKDMGAKRVKYDFFGLLTAAFYAAKKASGKDYSIVLEDSNKYFCSEFCAKMIQISGRGDLLSCAPYRYSPASLASSDFLKFIGQAI